MAHRIGGSFIITMRDRFASSCGRRREASLQGMFSSWQPRYFRLSNGTLSYFATPDDKVAKDLFDLATELGMDTLVEVHDAIELDRAMAFSPTLGHYIGLGFIRNGSTRIGEKVLAVNLLQNKNTEVEIVSHHFLDPEGIRQRG